MSNQIFKKLVPKSVLFDLLEQICLKTDKYYLVDHNSFKKMLFNNYHINFCKNLSEYYHLGKRVYIERKMTYNAFTTILRQICKATGILFASQIKYNESKYSIDYFIFLDATV
jgi:hypothetical protein